MSNDWTLPVSATHWVRDHIGYGSTVLELGSGEGTVRLAEWFTVITVEHDLRYLDLHPGELNVSYIHAPIKSGWYDLTPLVALDHRQYDCIIVDGPPGSIGRWGFVEHLDMFADVPILLDDVHRPAERELAITVAEKRKQSLSIHMLTDGRAFGVVGKI